MADQTDHRAEPVLPTRWTTALWLVDVHGVQPREAASLLGMSTPAVTALLTRARHALREQVLADHGRTTEH
ncbi:hypothetical protein ACFQV2_14375 [Actinokineospora soli]|uniref:Sigma-70, region 4 n=1 Tax=Actinokineospora soli TaxID=1048753 RepID=A0ABW2TLB8_9PSEU